jgi:copper chaperone
MNHTFTVTGMTCDHCEKAVTRAVHALDHTAQVTIDRTANKVEVVCDKPRALLVQAIADEGYAVSA